MLLIELGIYRNDIMSIILNLKTFFRSKPGLTKNIDSKKRFKYYLKNKPKNNNKKFIDNIKSISRYGQFINKGKEKNLSFTNFDKMKKLVVIEKNSIFVKILMFLFSKKTPLIYYLHPYQIDQYVKFTKELKI